jgi:hypothetical protein
MHARVGDRVTVDGHHVGQASRSGEVVEVISGASGDHYRVRWDDGHETIFFPSTDAHVDPRPVEDTAQL